MLTKSFKVLIVLTVAVLSFVALLVSGPPRVRGFRINTEAAIMATGQRLVVSVNQQIGAMAGPDVSIAPSTNYSVSSSGENIFIDFEEPLLSGQKYDVSINNIKSVSSGKNAKKSISFTTPEYSMAYIRRGAIGLSDHGMVDIKKPDQIITRIIGSKEESVLFEANRIDEISVLGDQIAVTVVRDDDSHEVALVSKNGDIEEIPLIGRHRISHMHGTADGAVFGFLARNLDTPPKERKSILTFYDSSSKLVFAFKQANSDADIVDWAIAPDGSIVAYRSSSGNLFLSPLDESEEPALFGKYDALGSFSHDTTILYASGGTNPVSINLETGIAETIDTPEVSGFESDSFELTPKRGRQGFIARTFLYSYATGSFTGYVIDVEPDKPNRQLYKSDSIKESVLSTGSTPNDQYVLIETSSSADALYDNYPTLRRPSNIQTNIIDVSTGEIIDRFNGFGGVVY